MACNIRKTLSTETTLHRL